MPRTPRTKSRTRAASAGRSGATPPPISDELMRRPDRGKLFADDGRKVRDTEHVGARSPDTDPPEPGAPAHATPGRTPHR